MPIPTTTVCAECRNDKPRITIALELDAEGIEVQEEKCSMCGVRKAWPWFHKWPLTEVEMDKV